MSRGKETMMKKRKPLNAGLDVEKFAICVPHDCTLWRENEETLEDYLGTLGAKIPKPDPCPKYDCKVCSCGPERLGYTLKGKFAVAHARRIQEKIQRQLLRFENVSAVDVGFAVREQTKRFINLLAIRIHVAKKFPVSLLNREGLPNFTSRAHVPVLKRALRSMRQVVKQGPGEKGEDKKLKAFLDRFKTLCEMCDVETCCLEEEWDQLRCHPYPISGVEEGDLSLHVYSECEDHGYRLRDCEIDSTNTEGCCKLKCRLAICGVPLDIIDAEYFPSVQHPGGDGRSGVFVDAPETAVQLPNQELLLTGLGRINPLVGGVSIGTSNGQAGTLGTIVWDRTDGSPCVLSNWHVLAGSASARVGQPCYQPAFFDGGRNSDTIAHLKRWHLGELGDAAIAELDGSRHYAAGEILGMWHPISGYKTPELNMKIRKWGRTTGFTEGFIDGVYLATNIDYGNGFVRHFKDQFHIAPLYSGQDVSQVGDSGSLVLTSYDLDDLDTIVRGLARTDTNFVEELKKKLGHLGPDAETIATEIKALLESLNSPNTITSVPPTQTALLKKAGEMLSILAPGTSVLNPLNPNAEAILAGVSELVSSILKENGFDPNAKRKQKKDKENRVGRRVYFAVGMIFAGDTPGSPFGEFALASDLKVLSKALRFSLRPVFEPRSSFRKLRNRPDSGGSAERTSSGRTRSPGDQGSDPRGQGPQPDGEPLQTGSGGG